MKRKAQDYNRASFPYVYNHSLPIYNGVLVPSWHSDVHALTTFLCTIELLFWVDADPFTHTGFRFSGPTFGLALYR